MALFLARVEKKEEHMSIRALILGIFAMLVALPAYSADPFTVYGIHVDAVADNAIEAQTKAIEDGQLRAANVMIERVSLPSERLAKGFTGVSPEDGPKLIRGLAIDNEKRSANRYLGDINVSFNPRAIEAYMRAKGLRLITTQSRKRLVIPALNNQPVFTDNSWNKAWQDKNLSSALTPLVAIVPRPEAYGILSTKSVNTLDMPTLKQLGQVYGTEQILIANAREGAGQYSVNVVDISLDTGETKKIGYMSAATPDGLIEKIVQTLENDWKQSVVSRDTGKRVVLPVSVLFRNQGEWISLQNLINNSAQIRSAQLEAISSAGALMNLVYGGDFERMKNELAYKGVEIRQDETLGTVLFKSGAFR